MYQKTTEYSVCKGSPIEETHNMDTLFANQSPEQQKAQVPLSSF